MNTKPEKTMQSIARTLTMLIIILLITALFTDAAAQCPMCKTNLEGAMKVEGSSIGNGINSGIMYLFAAPFLAAGTIGFLWYRESRKEVR